jgi:hypothetical protein
MGARQGVFRGMDLSDLMGRRLIDVCHKFESKVKQYFWCGLIYEQRSSALLTRTNSFHLRTTFFVPSGK